MADIVKKCDKCGLVCPIGNYSKNTKDTYYKTCDACRPINTRRKDEILKQYNFVKNNEGVLLRHINELNRSITEAKLNTARLEQMYTDQVNVNAKLTDEITSLSMYIKSLNGVQQHTPKQHDECVICLEPMVHNVKRLNCKHTFHTHCIRTNFITQLNDRCPLCRCEFTIKFDGACKKTIGKYRKKLKNSKHAHQDIVDFLRKHNIHRFNPSV